MGKEKKIIYRAIIGCPKHGSLDGKATMLKGYTKNNEKIPCYRCEICNVVYLEAENGRTGNTNHKIGKYEIWNTIGPVAVPNTIFLYDKKSGVGLCKCPGQKKKKLRVVTHFLINNGEVKAISGVKICLNCNKLFVTKAAYFNQKDFYEVNDIEVIDGIETTKVIQEEEHQKKDSVEKFTNYADQELEEAIFSNEEDYFEEETMDELTPASKVASAYYDANISFNPYQYLPWLKVYVNGTNNLLISDEVGLGKTIEAGILVMEELTENINAKILILCPAFLREKWYQELSEKFFLDVQIYDGKTAIDSMTKILVLPISRIKQYMEKNSVFNYSMVVVDEVHYFKNSKSARYGYLSHLLSEVGEIKRIFMSATPINNSSSDYYSIKELFGSEPDKTNTTKKQAYISLPERTVEEVYVELTEEEQNFYDTTDLLDPFAGTVYRHIGGSCLYALSKYAYSGEEMTSNMKEELRNAFEELFEGRGVEESEQLFLSDIKLIPSPQRDSKITKLKEILNGYKDGSKIVIFSHYIETVKYLHSELAEEFNVGYIYANSISSNIVCKNVKNKFIDAKNWFCQDSDKTTILICSDSCREGIDLDVANILINYDLPFNPSILEQRIGRIDRMSQKKNMYIYNFHVNGTYDDRLHFILAAKLRFVNFYADYGIGNPLNITPEENHVFNSFLRYFGRKIQGVKEFAVMSNDDYYVASKILRQIGVKLEKKAGIDSLQMQAIILDKFRENQIQIEKWFNKGQIRKITDQQLIKQKKNLEQLLNFPKQIRRKIRLENAALKRIVEKANQSPQFRKRIAPLIMDYDKKLKMMEISGMPMHISEDDFRTEYSFGTRNEDFIQSSIIEVLRNEGADVYEIE